MKVVVVVHLNYSADFTSHHYTIFSNAFSKAHLIIFLIVFEPQFLFYFLLLTRKFYRFPLHCIEAGIFHNNTSPQRTHSFLKINITFIPIIFLIFRNVTILF
ncbi:hypothetical protein BAVI_04434 [Neobacillus vireti LMG 21834]|uniref:Uncharacterized protein n=1 Tax=Neobacillus vireti LMG 21834 TaxID=1131730 RepID=A0AB94ISL1_9BACI|nr:hypothetical protein BAVI_04434 [Neobacillus vireti LMG 21834]KLT17224.1 hypothetical protein AA980_15175 [Neobacillus vireti]